MTGRRIIWEAFAGKASVTRAAFGVRGGLVAWLGAKERVASPLARVCDLAPAGDMTGVLLSDPGPWGYVWPHLIAPASRARVVDLYRRWARACPACEGRGGGCAVCLGGAGGPLDASALWWWLAQQGPLADPADRAAGWLWLQGRAASGAPVWYRRWQTGVDAFYQDGDAPEGGDAWRKGKAGVREERAAESGWRQGSAEGRAPQPMGERSSNWRMGHAHGAREHIIGQTGWVAQHGQGSPQAMRERDTWAEAPSLGEQRAVFPEVVQGRPNGRTQMAAEKNTGWRMGSGSGSGASGPLGEGSGGFTSRVSGVSERRSRGLVLTSSLADRVEGLGRTRWPAATMVFHGSAMDAERLLGHLLAADLDHLPDAGDDVAASVAHAPILTAGARRRVPELAPGAPPTLDPALARELAVFLDPPYLLDGEQERPRTGYGWALPLEQTLGLAARMADAGARVVITEGGPCARRLGPGWRSYEVGHLFRGRVVGEEWVTVNADVAWLGRPVACQVSMFCSSPPPSPGRSA